MVAKTDNTEVSTVNPTFCVGCRNTGNVILFIQAVRFSQIIVEVGVMGLLMTYLTDVRNEKLIVASTTMNVLEGMSGLLSIAAASLIEHLGCYIAVFFFSIFCSMGLGILWISALSRNLSLAYLCHIVSSKSSCTKKFELPLLYMALILLAVANAGFSSSIQDFQNDQLNAHCCDKLDEKKRCYKVSSYLLKSGNVGPLVYFYLWKRKMILSWIDRKISPLILLFFGYVLAFVCLGAVQSWTIRFGLSALAIRFGLVLLVTGQPYYFLDKYFRCVQEQRDDNPENEERNIQRRPICSVVSSVDDQTIENGTTSSWTTLLRMVPICLTFLMYGTVKSIGSTFFLEQGNSMDRALGPHDEVKDKEVTDDAGPLAILLIVMHLSRFLIKHLVDLFLSQRLNGAKHIYAILIRIGVGMLFSVICCSIAQLVEAKRLNVIKKHDLLDKPDLVVPMSLFWLLPQYISLGVMRGLAGDGLEEFFESELPNPLKSYASAFSEAVIGVGVLLSAVLVIIAEKTSKLGGGPSWFADTINRSHLDNFFRMLTIMCLLSLFLYACVSTSYIKNRSTVSQELDSKDLVESRNQVVIELI